MNKNYSGRPEKMQDSNTVCLVPRGSDAFGNTILNHSASKLPWQLIGKLDSKLWSDIVQEVDKVYRQTLVFVFFERLLDSFLWQPCWGTRTEQQRNLAMEELTCKYQPALMKLGFELEILKAQEPKKLGESCCLPGSLRPLKPCMARNKLEELPFIVLKYTGDTSYGSLSAPDCTDPLKKARSDGRSNMMNLLDLDD
eukprot:gene16452-19531_t